MGERDKEKSKKGRNIEEKKERKEEERRRGKKRKRIERKKKEIDKQTCYMYLNK